uniref:uncharacterized protein prr14 isoform X1 n=1 Tax=Epinephelus lanceolatus TaxID=310571 RepID=UPI0014473E56|nr:uncharacterized protein prr14 isoform X1 [Epinephelus lanceolatus]XP_033500855.1 uncharacterized protein prr14 isoform X1 [Epinephelus lanceolatus]
MLTYPSDSLPQIVCPMDEDAIPPNSFCSAPPHSEPSPPLLPFSSITPSHAKDGISGHRRSGRIQEIRAQTPKKQSNTVSAAAPRQSRQNPSPTKRQRESANMVRLSQSKQQRAQGTHVHEKQNKDGIDISFAAKRQNKQKDQKKPQKKPNVSAAENVVGQIAVDTTQNLDTTTSDMGRLAVGPSVENASAPKGWVIGPLFQSLRSKMASFTEIVMSPVKLFRANSPPPFMDRPDRPDECEPQADGMSDVEHSEPGDMFHPEAQSENENQDTEAKQQRLSEVEGAQNAKTVALRYSKKLSFDVELPTHSSEWADECAISQKGKHSPDSVPLHHSPLPCTVSEEVSESVGSVLRSSMLLQPSVTVSASLESKLMISGATEDQKGRPFVQLKPLPRKYTGNRSGVKKVSSKVKKEESDPEVNDEQVSLMNSAKSNKAHSSDTDKTQSLSSSVCYAQPDTDCPQPNDGDSRKKVTQKTLVRRSHKNNLNTSTNGRTLKPTLDTQQLECHLNPETYLAAGVGRAKRGLKLDCHSQDFVKRKRLTADKCTKDPKTQALLNVASDSGILSPPIKDVLTNTIVHKEEMLKPPPKRQPVSTRANKRENVQQEMLATINETVLNTRSESSSDAMLVCSLDKSSGISKDKQKNSSSKMKPGASCKRLKTRTGLDAPDVNKDNSMDLETTVAITSTEQAEKAPLSEVLVRPHIKQLPSTSKQKNINTKPRKRKSPNQVSSSPESDSILVSTSPALSTEPLELTSTDFNTSEHVQKEDSPKKEVNQPFKRPRKSIRGAVKSSASGASEETKQCMDNLHLITKENKPREGKGKLSMDPVYFEMTPFESNQQPAPSPSKPKLDCYVQLDHEIKHIIDGKELSATSVSDEVFSTDAEASHHNSSSVSRLRSSARRANIRPRRADNQRRKCRVLHGRTCKDEEATNTVTMDDADLATASSQSAENGSSRCLLRSYSCPEIPSLRHHDMPWTPTLHSPHHSRTHTPHLHQSSHTPSAHHAHKSLRRARRHTVCSVEVEREIAPLCLRKEVYPSRRSLPYDRATLRLCPSLALSPSTSLSVLASCFLSSPLAFLSKKVDSRGSSASPSTSSHVSSPISSSSSISQLLFPQRNDSSSATLDYSSSGNPLECEMERRQQSEEEDDGEDTSSSSQEFEDVGMREEKALSDSEIKVVQKHEERGKVSSIRIRKTLPKPQTNLTPMGLPKPIRLKKKEFSLEEIYTNKNFSKPPESRLETIFEVPLNRRNGSESWFGQRRVKRFLEFLEAGEARRPKKPLAGIGKAVASSSRTRRGGSPKDEPSLSAQDVDSLLCEKLEQLNLWLIRDQKDS